MFYVGLDVHQHTASVCVLDDQGNRVREVTVKGHWTKLGSVIPALPGPRQVCFEASTSYGVLYEMLSRNAERVAVAHPGHLRLIFRSKRKNDRADAFKLALLLRLNEVPEVYVPGAEVRQWRRMIRLRHRLVEDRVRTKNRIRNLLRQYGLQAPHSLWSLKGLVWLNRLELPLEGAAIERDLLLDDLKHQNARVKRLESALNPIAQAHPAVCLLRTIPGVGARTAEAFAAWVDRPARFTGAGAIGSYFGLVPSEDSSAHVKRLGHITKQGPGLMRKLLVEAAWQAIRRDTGLRALFDRVRREDPDRTKIAIVAVAHQLAKVMLAILKRGTGFQPALQAA